MKNPWNNNTEMSIIEHLNELRNRIFASLTSFFIITTICFIYTKEISFILQRPAFGIKFLQLAPGEYLFASIKMAIYTGFLISSPFTLYQIILFILPGLTRKETYLIVPTISLSVILFFVGLIFSYKILIPSALQFLIKYGSDVVEPIWSFGEYFNFIIILLFSTGLAFQIPVIQVILGIYEIISADRMLSYWKYIIFISTVISAILTPSTDPITQIFMSLAIFSLYLSGIIILKGINK